MFRCVLCLKSCRAEDATKEHVFPQAIGGRLTLNEMCARCNSHLGDTIDARLVDHRYMQWSRRNLKLTTQAGRVPNPLERGTVPTTGQQVRWEPDGRVYFHPAQQQRDDGTVVLIVDERDEERLPEMLEKASRRRGVHVQGKVVRQTENVSLSFELGFDDERYALGILKIAYELGYKVLGASYLDDPLAARFRSVLSGHTPPGEVSELGVIGGLFGPPMVPVAQHSDSSLTGVVFRIDDRIHAYVRLFDRFDGRFTLSQHASAYSCTTTGRGWLIDVATGAIRETNIDELRGATASTMTDANA